MVRKLLIWTTTQLEYQFGRKSLMLSSMMSTTSAMATSALSTTSAMSAFTTIGVAEVSIAAVICLIVLLSALEIHFASKLRNKNLSFSFSLAIPPLIVIFIAIVVFNVLKAALILF